MEHAAANGLTSHAPRPSIWGSKNANAIFTESEVTKIKKRLRLGETQTAIAREFDTSQSVISSIHLRKTWKHIP